MDTKTIQKLQPYPLSVEVGDTVIDWNVKYFQSEDENEYKGKVVSLTKPEGFERDASGYEWTDEDHGQVLVQFGDGKQFIYPTKVEHYLAKEGDAEVPVADAKPFLQLEGRGVLDMLMPSCQSELIIVSFFKQHEEHYKDILASL